MNSTTKRFARTSVDAFPQTVAYARSVEMYVSTKWRHQFARLFVRVWRRVWR